jgi:tetratricopeptide (TPR) repeat protein
LRAFRSVILLFLILANVGFGVDASPQELLRTGKADEARRILEGALQRNSNDAGTYILLCRLYFQLELWDNALLMSERAVALDPNNSNYHMWLGRSAGRKAENSNPFAAWSLARRVRAEFERAVALVGYNLGARADLSEYSIEAPGFLGGDIKKAREQAAAVAPHDEALADYIYARIEEQQGKSDAEQLYKKALAASGNSARYWIEISYFYRRAGRVQDMQSAIYQALIAPRHGAIPEYDGAYLFLRTGRDFPNAVAML